MDRDGCPNRRTLLRGTLHPQARHGAAGGLRRSAPQGGRDRRADGGHRRPAAVHGHRHRLRPDAGPGPLHGDRRRLPHLRPGRQPFPDRRAGGRLHRAGGVDRGAARRGRADAGHHAFGAGAPRRGLPAARDLHQVHTLPGDGRLHGGKSRSSSSPARSGSCWAWRWRRSRGRCCPSWARSRKRCRRSTPRPWP